MGPYERKDLQFDCIHLNSQANSEIQLVDHRSNKIKDVVARIIGKTLLVIIEQSRTVELL